MAKRKAAPPARKRAPTTGARRTGAKAKSSKRAASPRPKASRKPAKALKHASPTPRVKPATTSVAAPARSTRRSKTTPPNVVPTPPSSLDLDRHPSAARTGRTEIMERMYEHTETSPGLTGGDVDADWQSAYSVGDEAPGGDNPTPDQDVVDEIGRALGVQYEDNEELKGSDKIAERDRRRWELDPASSEDYQARNRKGRKTTE